VDEKLAGWIRDGYVTEVERKPHCSNPLTVMEKRDFDSGQIKYRVVLDMSRHVNSKLAPTSIQLDDLQATEALKTPEDYMCIFDLVNQYFHVRLHPAARQYFGFSWKDQDGKDHFYIFHVMVYGFAAAAAVVTRLIKPIMG